LGGGRKKIPLAATQAQNRLDWIALPDYKENQLIAKSFVLMNPPEQV